jgi:hypothetical protein
MFAEIEKFKDVMKEGMIKNFEADGCLMPVLFFIDNGELVISQIPNFIFMTEAGKDSLANLIKDKCVNPSIQAAGMVIEAWGAKIDAKSDAAKALLNNEISVSELDEKQDIIMLIFSTPTKSETIAYVVDADNKKIIKEFGEGIDLISGRFANFFQWSQN